MSKIAEIITVDGEVFTATDYNTQNEFEFKVLNSLSFEIVKDFFVKKQIYEKVKQKNALTNGSNGVTYIELIDLFKWVEIQIYLDELERKNIIEKRQGINLDMYFIKKK